MSAKLQEQVEEKEKLISFMEAKFMRMEKIFMNKNKKTTETSID
jgi:Holliday junction resolvasome RuvABC endonuclease subunit